MLFLLNIIKATSQSVSNFYINLSALRLLCSKIWFMSLLTAFLLCVCWTHYTVKLLSNWDPESCTIRLFNYQNDEINAVTTST